MPETETRTIILQHALQSCGKMDSLEALGNDATAWYKYKGNNRAAYGTITAIQQTRRICGWQPRNRQCHHPYQWSFLRMIVSLEIHHLPKLCIRVDKAGIREAGTMIILLTTGQQESITIFSISGQPKKLLHMPCYTSLLNNHEEPDLSDSCYVTVYSKSVLTALVLCAHHLFYSGYHRKQNYRNAFLQGFLAVFLTYSVLYLFRDIPNEHMLSNEVAGIFLLPDGYVLLGSRCLDIPEYLRVSAGGWLR